MGVFTPPLDGAADRHSLGNADRLAGQDLVQGLAQVVTGHFGGIAGVVIDAPVVDEGSLRVEDEPSCPETHLPSRALVWPVVWYSLSSCIPLCWEELSMEKAVGRGLDWAGLPVIATVARLLCRELTLQNEYLRLENRILKEKIPGRLRFTDEERRSLTEAARRWDAP